VHICTRFVGETDFISYQTEVNNITCTYNHFEWPLSNWISRCRYFKRIRQESVMKFQNFYWNSSFRKYRTVTS